MKKSKYVILADKKKLEDINDMIKIRDLMIENNIEKSKIDNFIKEQYNKINKEYADKIKKYNEKYKKKEQEKNRKESIDFLIKNKNFLEESKVNEDYIKKYVEIQYNRINEKFNEVDNVSFID